MPETKRKLKNGLWFSEGTRTWHFSFRIFGRKNHEKGDTGLPSFAMAKLWLADYKAKLRRQTVGLAVAEAPPTLQRALDEWEAAHRGLYSDNYVNQMMHLISTHLERQLQRPLDAVTTRVMEAARKGYLGGSGSITRFGKTWALPHSLGGANTFVKMVNALFGWILSDRPSWLAARPFTLHQEKVQQVPRPVVWPEQVTAFLAEVDTCTFTWRKQKVERERALSVRMAIRAQLCLGLRESEAVGFRWEWMNWRNKLYAPGATKNRKTRQIPVPEWLLQELQDLWKAAGRPAEGLAWSWMDGKGQAQQHASGLTRDAVAAAGLRIGIADLHPHRLRATFATTHWEVGTELAKIQQMMGHRDPATTLRYIETRPTDAAKAQEKVAEHMGLKPQVPSRSPLEDGAAAS